jgi:sugar phosphate isomerase/epimerase
MILAGTGMVTRNPDFPEHERILRHGGSIPAEALELGLCTPWFEDGAAERIGAELAASGLSFPVVHAEKAIGARLSDDDPSTAVARFAANVELARAVGATTVVLHLWELPAGDTLLERNLAALPALLDVAAAAGIVLTVETIPCSVGTPLTNVRRTLEADERVRVTLDTEFLAFHGELEAAFDADWLWRDGRVAHVHVKDFGGSLRRPDGSRRYLIPGEGSLDLPAFLGALRDRSYDATITLEAPGVQDDGEPDWPRIAEGLQRLRELAS